ncbi:glycyl-radical enzyme activating protein [Chloroflexota bacterium]
MNDKELSKQASKLIDIADEVGLVTDIQDFAVHDGPGLRVIVFLKGCTLKCDWCQNPESINPSPEIAFHTVDCLECFRCLDVCPVPGAIIKDKEQRIDRSKCTKCMDCVEVCLGKALREVGESMKAGELLKRIERYKPFFNRSDRGGLTLSGGEPLFQPQFSLSVLKLCRKDGIHTAIETCGYAPYEILEKVGKAADLVLYDIKHMNEQAHINRTGNSNSLILANLERFCRETDSEVAIRLPLISDFNDDDTNVMDTARFVSSLGKIKRLDLLPFNELASAKYKIMDSEWKYAETKQQSPKKLAKLRKIVETYGLETTIGGLW